MVELTAKDIHALIGDDYPIMLEIGCNDGTDTQRFLDEMPTLIIYCFEPDLRAVSRFRQRVHDGRARLHQTAVGDVVGTIKFYGSSGQPPQASLRPDSSHYCFLPEWDLSGSIRLPTGHLTRSPWVLFPKVRESMVGCTTLDAWLDTNADISHIDFIWMDVQGAEDAVIRGAPNVLAMTRYLYTEYSDKPLYQGQVSLAVLQAMLPQFELLSTHCENALFKNKDLP